jgi:rRNA maturation protein Nop10
MGGVDGFIAKIQDCHISNSCVAADLPILVSDAVNDTICPGGMVNLSVVNSNLNSATHWQWYTGGCGVVPVDTGAQITEFLGTSRTLYVRGEGGPLNPGPCDSIRIGTYAPITNNILSVNQQLCQPGVPLAITGTLPQGGNGVYTYIWRSATDINSFTIIPGATNRDYFPGIVSQTTYYRRQAISQCPNAVFSLNHAVEVQPFANSIGNSQVILYGTAPLNLTGTSQRPAPWFQWHASHDLNTWNPITGAVGADYQPGILARTTYYRREAGGIHNCNLISGNIITIEVVELLSQLVQVQSNSPVCQGMPVYFQIQAPSGATFAWTGPGNFSASQQNPSISNIQTSQAGIYRLRVTLPNGDTIIHTHLIQVGSPLNVLTAGYNQPLCYGTKLDLSATSLPFVSYSWQGPGGFTATGASVMRGFDYQQSLQGIYTLTAVSPGCGSTTRAVQVQVNTNFPTVQQSPLSICRGAQFSLDATAGVGAGFTWFGPNGFSTTLRSFVRTGTTLTSGNYTLVQTMPGCPPATLVHTVFVAPYTTEINSSTNSPLCQNRDLSLYAASIPGVQYQWTGPGGFISTQAHVINPMIDRSLAGNYILTMTYPGCFTQTRSHTVQVNNPIEAGMVISPAQACTGNQIIFSTSALPNAVYLWTGPNGFTSTQSYFVRNSANTSMAGVYTLSVTQPGCAPVLMEQSLSVTPSLSLLSVSPAQVVCAPANLSLSGASIPNAQMSWEGPNGFTAAGSSFSIPVTQANQGGTYRYRVQTTHCGTVFRNVNVTVRDTGALVVSAVRDTFCVGQVAYFSATPISGATYAWTGPAAFNSVLSSPARSNLQAQHSGTYSLQVQVPGCGTLNRSLALFVQLPPAFIGVNIVNLSGPLCIPASLTLAGTVVPGYDMRWEGPMGFTASGATFTTPITQVQQGGAYRYIVSTQNCGSHSRSENVIVNAPGSLTAFSNLDTFCTGEVAYFAVISNTTGTHTWSGPAGFSSSQMNPSRSNLQTTHSGVYTVQTNVPGCGIQSSTVSILVHSPVSNVSVPSSLGVCAPNSLTFSGSALPGTHSWWAGPNGFTSAGANVNIPVSHPNQSGTWSYHISASRCWSTFRTLSVVVNASGMPEGTISSPVCVSDPVYMQATFIAGATYQWQGPDGFVANTQNTSRSKATPLMAGMYTLSVTTPHCGTQSRELQLVVNNCRNGMPAEDILESESQASDMPALRVYPNPVTHTLYFEAGQPIEWIQLQDLQGRILSDYSVHQQSGHIDLPAHLSTGMYMAVFKSENGVQYRKIQKH